MSDVIEREVGAWCGSYIEAFCDFDVDAITGHWMYPAIIMQGLEIFQFADAAVFKQNVRRLCDFYRREGVVSAVRDVDAVLQLMPDVASIRVYDRMLNVMGREIASWQSAYTLRNTPEGWRAVFAVADGETDAWAARGTPLGQ